MQTKIFEIGNTYRNVDICGVYCFVSEIKITGRDNKTIYGENLKYCVNTKTNEKSETCTYVFTSKVRKAPNLNHEITTSLMEVFSAENVATNINLIIN